MKVMFKSVSSSSTMIEGFSYDRANFEAKSLWNRSLLSGAISTGLTGLGVYCGYLMADPAFAGVLGDQALQAKIAASGLICALLGYSLRDLFSSITHDVTTKLRVARANSWLSKGTAHAHDLTGQVAMQQTQLSMVRFVEVDGGIKVFAIAKHEQHESPFLIETMLFDEEYPAHSVLYTHKADIRSRLNEACAEWAPEVADLLCIQLDSAPASSVHSLEEQHDDLDLGDDFAFDDLVPAAIGRASASSAAKLNADRAVAPNKADLLRKAGTIPSDARIQ